MPKKIELPKKGRKKTMTEVALEIQHHERIVRIKSLIRQLNALINPEDYDQKTKEKI